MPYIVYSLLNHKKIALGIHEYAERTIIIPLAVDYLETELEKATRMMLAYLHSAGLAGLALMYNAAARREELYNTIVANGYMSKKAIDLMIDAGLDAANIDVKGCEGVKVECEIDVGLVWQNAIRMKEKGVHVELTTLMVPGLSNDLSCIKSIAERIHDDLGTSTPWYLSRYFPVCEYDEPPTRIQDLLAAKEMGKENELDYVYVGNVHYRDLQNTLCPSCGSLCYERSNITSINKGVTKDGCCASCGTDLNFSALHGEWKCK